MMIPFIENRYHHPSDKQIVFRQSLVFNGKTLNEVSAFLASCQYVEDIDQFKQRDWWIHPAQFEKIKRGDCEDHALWAWRAFHNQGQDARLMLGRCGETGHAWVQLYTEEDSFIFEATGKHDVPLYSAAEYVPEYSFKRLNDGRFMMFDHKQEGLKAPESIPAKPRPLPKRPPLPQPSPLPQPLPPPEHWVGIDQLIFEGKKNDAHRAIRIAMQGKGSYTREFLNRYFHLREHHPDSFELDDEAYWEDWTG